ncbi:MAG: hypothetical protein KA515_02365 [Candidatus Pacebacteria bacterium]|nr:hypothetical protein [Candidatus Paceibacterota bacterium]
MKIAVMGPLVKDIITIDHKSETYMGGIPYYEALALKSFGVQVVAYVTYALRDENFVKDHMPDIKVVPFYTKNTITHELVYDSKNPNEREVKVPEYDPSVFPVEENIISELKSYDYVLLGPLYFENIPDEFFEKMKGHNLAINNFGLFSYHEKGTLVHKNPENFVRAAPFLKCISLDEYEMKFASQKNTFEEGARFFVELGVEQVIVTRGSNGSVIFTKDKEYIIPAFPPKKLIDPTGAGDTYLAGFIFSQELFGDDLEMRGRFAAMSATIAIECAGAYVGNTQEVLDRLGEY